MHMSDSVFTLDMIVLYQARALSLPLPSPLLACFHISNVVPCLSMLEHVRSMIQ